MIKHLKRPSKNFKIAIPLMIVATIMAALQAASVKLATKYLSVNFLVFGRSLFNLFLFFLWHLIQHKKMDWYFLYHTKAWKLHLIRSGAGVASLYCFYYGVNFLSLAPATLLFFSFPLFTPLVARVWLGVKLFHNIWWGLILAFIGVLFVIRPGAELMNLWALVPLFGALLGAVALVAVRCLHYTDPSERTIAYFFTMNVLVGGIVFLLFMKISQEVFTLYSLGLTLLAGLFATLFQGFMTQAMKYGPARLLSPFTYLGFIFSFILDLVIWHTPIHKGLLFGFVLILSGTILLVLLYPKEDLVFKR